NEENAKDPYLPQAVFAAALGHPATFTEQARQNQPIAKADSLMSLSERVMKGLLSEQYPLDRRAQLQFPPDVTDKEIVINAVVSKGDEPLEGVIVAQGGKANGYSLYVQNKALIWLVKQNGQAYQVRTTQLPETQFTVTASLLEGGEMTLDINGKQRTEERSAGTGR